MRGVLHRPLPQENALLTHRTVPGHRDAPEASHVVWEILLAVFCAIGLAACIRFAVGRLVYPVRGAIILLPALGDGRLLEQQLKG